MEGDAGSGQLTPTPPLTPDGTTESGAGESAAVPASRLAGGRWLVGACVVLGAATMALVAAGVLALLGNRGMASSGSGEEIAVAAAKECIAATQAPDVKAMVQSQRKIIECATENYAPQANLYSGIIADAYDAVQAQVKIADIRAAAERHNPDGSIDVLVATRVSMSNLDEQGQEVSYRLRVTMVPSGDTYKIDSIEPVSR